jgi:RimJ/RimL family protein N-acetyltransferase
MIVVVENEYFVEAIFRHSSDAKQYMEAHPQKENCKVRNMDFNNFPFYIVEIGRGKFLYFPTKENLAEYVNKLKIEDIPIGKTVSFGGNSNHEVKEEPQFILYIIEETFEYERKNEDRMGLLDHVHIDWGMVLDFQAENDFSHLGLDEQGLKKHYSANEGEDEKKTAQKKLPKKLCVDDITLVKFSRTKDTERMNELVEIYNKNYNYLKPWHLNNDTLVFKEADDYATRLLKCKLIAYGIYVNDELIGLVEITKLTPDNAEYRNLSFWIAKKHTRKGIATRVISAIDDMLFRTGLNYIEADAVIGNEPSDKLLQKLGYKMCSVSHLIGENGKEELGYKTYRLYAG